MLKRKIKKIFRNIFLDFGGWIGARYIYRELIAPFFASIGVVSFILLVQFLLREIDRLLGKNLPVGVVLEFLVLNLMHIIALSIPMAVLVASLRAYGRLSEDNEITAMRSSGINFLSILKPGIIFGITVTLTMFYFHNSVLPHTNHKARLLTGDITEMRPSIKIQPGYFIDDIPKYSIYVKDKENELLKDITIYNKSPREKQQTIFADSGRVEFVDDQLIFHLYSGEIHELQLPERDQYNILEFQKHLISLSVDDMVLERTRKGRRGAREMTVAMMMEEVNKYRNRQQEVTKQIRDMVKEKLDSISFQSGEQLTNYINSKIDQKKEEYSRENSEGQIKELTSLLSSIKSKLNLRQRYKEEVYSYLTEVHKKYSLPVACIIFILIGAPLGVMTRKGGNTAASIISLVFFLIYYIFLVGGEELADKTIITPFWAMWTPNIILAIIGVILIHSIVRDRITIEFTFIKKFLPTSNNKKE